MEQPLFPPPRPAYRPGLKTAKTTWSYSRRESSKQCLAHYYFEYYGSSTTKALDDPDKGKLRFLKKLSNCHLRAGQLLHQSLSTYLSHLREGSAQTEQEVRDRALGLFEKDIEFSSASAGGVLPFDPVPRALLLEYYYGLGDAQEQGERMYRRLDQAITNFFNHDAFRHLHDPKLLQDALIEEGLKTRGALSLEGRLDLVYFVGDGAVVCDWKIGGPEYTEDDLQLLTYALLIQERLGISPERIELQRVHLADAEITRFTASQTNIERARHRILQDVQRLSMLEALGWDGQRDVFYPVNNPAVCKLCPYQGVCLGERHD